MSLTVDHIHSTLQSLPLQHRTMIRLLLLQYFDVPQDEIDFMATDQPDSRFLSGSQPQTKTLTLEAVQNITARIDQYKIFYRQKRERPGMHVQYLEQSLSLVSRKLRIVTRLLKENFNVSDTAIQEAQQQAPRVLIRQERRKLSRSWEQEEIAEKEYQHSSLLLEFQGLARKQTLLLRRLKMAKQDFLLAGSSPLKDHEIAHIWGIPLGSLASRKVKALQLFLTGLQDLDQPMTTAASKNYWEEALKVLANQPFERSLVEYDGLERTEENLMEKLRQFLSGSMTEPEESKFWTSITKVNDSEYSGSWRSHARSILAFQRLHALLHDLDFSDDVLEEEVLANITPQKPEDKLATPESEEQPVELSEMGMGVLNAFAGEVDDKRTF